MDDVGQPRMDDDRPEAGPAGPDWAEGMEQAVLDAAIALAPAMGWTRVMARAAAERCGLNAAEADLLFPEGPRDLAALFSRRHDARAIQALSGVAPKDLKVRERIRQGVTARLAAALADEAAVRRCLGFLAFPAQAELAARLVWESADVLWRWAGDDATDENHYSKRAILAAILTSTLMARLWRGEADAQAHLERRIADVMRFEAWKARRKPLDLGPRLVQAVSRIRYGRA